MYEMSGSSATTAGRIARPAYLKDAVLEGKGAVSIDLILKTRFADGFGDHVHSGSEEMRELFPELFQLPKKSKPPVEKESFTRTAISMSESGPASPRATEPNSERRTMPARFRSCSCARSVARMLSRLMIYFGTLFRYCFLVDFDDFFRVALPAEERGVDFAFFD